MREATYHRSTTTTKISTFYWQVLQQFQCYRQLQLLNSARFPLAPLLHTAWLYLLCNAITTTTKISSFYWHGLQQPKYPSDREWGCWPLGTTVLGADE